jgi:hypothetical protein
MIFGFLWKGGCRQRCVVQRFLPGRRCDVGLVLVACQCIRIVCLDRSMHGNRHCGVLGLWDRRLSLVITDVADRDSRVVIGIGQLKCMYSWAGGIFLVADCGRNAIELESCAGGAWPRIGCRRIALDFASSASFASSHNLQSLMPVVFVHKYVVCS